MDFEQAFSGPRITFLNFLLCDPDHLPEVTSELLNNFILINLEFGFDMLETNLYQFTFCI